MNPSYLHTLTSARSASMPIDEPRTVSELVALLDRESPRTAVGKQTVVFRPSFWTSAECAMACAGMDERYFNTLRYSFALDDSVRSRLWSALFQWAIERREWERWPSTVKTNGGKDRKYMDDLVRMALVEERVPWRFIRRPNDPDMRRVLMDVAEHTWRRKLSPVYESIVSEYVSWRSIGLSFMRPWLDDCA
jgi:hypothetical protein